MRKAIPVEKRVAIGLYRLCSSKEERSIAELFTVGHSTVNQSYRELCEAVFELMEDDWVKMSTLDTMPEHRELNAAYHIILLAFMDHRYRSLYIQVGSPGRCHESHVYSGSKLKKAVNGPLFRQPRAIMGFTGVPPVILCDQALPLSTNLMKPFSHRANLTDDEKLFNYRLYMARRVVENAFGRLKARFGFVLKRME
ncbi:uncharacterized protein LOC144134414 [Amblyomma americanum]